MRVHVTCDLCDDQALEILTADEQTVSARRVADALAAAGWCQLRGLDVCDRCATSPAVSPIAAEIAALRRARIGLPS